MTKIEKIKAMFDRQTAEMIPKIKEWRATGNQAAIDEHFQYVVPPNLVDMTKVKDDWTFVQFDAIPDWRVMAWIRDNLTGLVAVEYSGVFDAHGNLHFERPEDAFHFKMRWIEPKD